ncbi:MAG: DNA-deoxyinosine glycosylase [Clostridia bacterium]
MKNSFQPLSHSDCTILILGSLPGEISLQQQQYYAHPRNAFWKIMFEILGEEFSDDYDKRKAMLLKNNIALWDVIESANRKGSLDSDIRDVVVNDFDGFFKEHTKIEKIILNGGKASSLFKRYCKNIDIQAFSLPSTSPANARMSFEEKLEVWREIILK